MLTILKKLTLVTAIAMMTMTPVHAAEKITLILDWFLNPNHAPLIVAQQIGAFEQEGLEVELVEPADPGTPPRLVAAKKADLAISYQPQLYMYADQGLPLVRIATLVDSPLNCLLCLKAGGIDSITDLKGRKIGYSLSGTQEATLGTMLATGGLTLDDVDMINVNFQLVSAILTGRVDCVINAQRTFEAIELREHGVEPVIMNVEDYGIPAYDELIILANKDNATDPKYRKFIAALKKGAQYLLAHPIETWNAFAKAHPDLDNALNKTAWKQTLALFAKDPARLDAARYRAYGAFLAEHDLISKQLPVGDYAIELD